VKGALAAQLIRLGVTNIQNDETISRNSLRYLKKSEFTYNGSVVARVNPAVKTRLTLSRQRKKARGRSASFPV